MLLVGAAEFYKNMLNNAGLRHLENGIRHVKDTLRPYFVMFHGNQEFVLWIGRVEVISRIVTAFVDLFHHDSPEAETQEFVNLSPPALRAAINELKGPDQQRQSIIEAHEDMR